MANTTPSVNLDTTENTETTILEILAEIYPNLDCGPGTPVYEMVVRPTAYLWARQAEGAKELLASVSFEDYANMSKEDMDRLMSRYFIYRRGGINVNGIARCIVDGTKDLIIYAGEIWESGDIKTYEVLSNHIIKQDEWEELTPLGKPIHWYTERTDALDIVKRVAVFNDLKTLIDTGIAIDTGKYLVTDDQHAYVYDASKGQDYDPESEDPEKKDAWKRRWTLYTDILYPIPYTEVPADDKIFYEDVGLVSTGTGSVYNANQNDIVTPTGTAKDVISSAYFLAATNDGGAEETNYELYNRAKDTLALRGMVSYKSIVSLLRENFETLKQVVPIGMRDTEMIRDLDTVKYQTSQILVHTGGKCDIYIKDSRYITERGYVAPLGFPLEWGAYSMASSPNNLMLAWNNSVVDMTVQNKGKRGSLLEVITGIDENSSITNLKTDLYDVDEFLNNGNNTSVCTDNLVKQMWPIVVVANITIESDNPENDIALAKRTVSTYINSLETTEAPQVAEIAHILRAVGIKEVHVPVNTDTRTDFLRAYYLKDSNLHMEYFGLKKEYSSTSILIPIEDDSLAFRMKDTAGSLSDQTQISLRTCSWYSNDDLINIKVASN